MLMPRLIAFHGCKLSRDVAGRLHTIADRGKVAAVVFGQLLSERT